MWSRVFLYGIGLGAVLILVWCTWIRKPAVDPQDAGAKAIELAAAGKMDDALRMGRQITKEFPTNPRGPLVEGFVLDGLKRYDEAQDAYRTALERTEGGDMRRHIMLAIADIDRRRGNFIRARKYLELAINEHGRSYRTDWLGRQLDYALGIRTQKAPEDGSSLRNVTNGKNTNSPLKGIPERADSKGGKPLLPGKGGVTNRPRKVSASNGKSTESDQE